MSDKKKVLVVDDEPDCQEFVKAVLEPEGFEVITAANGQDGLEKAAKEKPDLIILDVQMPLKDGFQVFSELKQSEKTRGIPVIMLTGIKEKVGIGFSAGEMGQFIGKQPDEYLEKPIDPEKLKELVKKVLKI